MDEWKADRYKPGDEGEILRLFEETFGEKRSLALWRWRYEERPGATDTIALVRDERGRLVGHYACLPFEVAYRQGTLPAVFRLDFMVHPDYQNKGIGGALIDTQRENLRRNYELSFAFPNPTSVFVTMKKGVQHLEEAPLYWRLEKASALLKNRALLRWLPRPLMACADLLLSIPLNMLALSPAGSKRYRVRRGERFDGETACLAAAGREGCGIYVPRDEAFLRWRFDRHPEMDYAILFLVDAKAGGGPCGYGYVVLAVKEYQGFNLGFIVDILVHPPGLRPTRYLLSRAVSHLEKHGVEAICCLMTGSNRYTRALSSLGFIRVPQRYLPRTLFLTLRAFNPRPDTAYATDPDNWILTWADTDLV